MEEKRPLVLILTECHNTTDLLDCEIAIEGYEFVRCDSHSKHTGGIIIYVIKNVQIQTVISQAFQDKLIWFLKIELKLRSKVLTVCGLYRSPSGKFDDFNSFIINEFSVLCQQKNDVFIIGDFNVDWFSETPNSKKLREIARNH